MFAVHFQIDVGNSVLASAIKSIIAFTEARDWTPLTDDALGRGHVCRTATEAARAAGLFAHNAAFVNCGEITDMVDIKNIDHAGHGLVVNTKLQIPSLFYVADDMVRCPHINFDFQDYTRFEFVEGRMIIQDLTEIDKTMLRLASSIRKEKLSDGTTGERIA